ncbi:hypothetical protein [Segetibacter koreensis]|uniref:hypothetical protein n=1 Tax=Segetibacter koreensis TaxID=398037 RepID=UPI00035D417D|nr:hypothetical protein [Segetibacter koreensis]
MKKLSIFSLFLFIATYSYCQDFKQEVATAKSSYKSGKLEDAHFALQQTLQALDITIGKEVLKLFPAKMDTLPVNIKDDNVAGNVSFVGATIHRSYGMGEKKAEVEIVNNSPMLGTLNAFLTSPLLAGLGNDGKSKVLKIQGFKSRLTKEDSQDQSKPSYKLEMPMSNALITLHVDNTNESEILAMANTIPFDKIAKLIQ